MDAVFITLLNMSITASWLVLAVVLLRFLLKRAPKWIMGVLWGFVAFRLIFPFSLESVFSLIPSAETIPQNILIAENPTINSGFVILNQAVNPIISDTLAPNVGDSISPMQIITFIASVIWIIGIIAMGIYTVLSFIRVRKKVKEAVPLKDDIWVCDHISTPFILGFFRPRIYIPSSMNEADTEYVIFHEKAHLKRKDHIWKPLGFLLLSVYWFNPFLWLAYVLLCKDIELACDEKVIRQFGAEIKKPYSEALINCSVPRKMISACPLAFGETGVKERVKGVLNYKKPSFWIILVAVVACIITAVCLLTNPKSYDVTNLDDSLQVLLDTQITEHHKSENTKDNFAVTDYKILEVDDSPFEAKVYMWVLYIEYSNTSGELKEEAGAHIPTVITAKKKSSANKNGLVSYEPVEYWEPGDGSQYESDIKEKFPKHLWGKALDGQQYIDKQKSACLKSAMEHYGISESKVGGADEPQNIVVNPSGYSLVYHCSSEKDNATLSLEPQSKKFTFTYSLLSSYFAVGTYEEDNGFIVAHTDDGKFKYTFKKDGKNIVFVADKSSEMPSFAYSSGGKAETCIPNGAVFECIDTKDVQSNANSYFNAEVIEVNEQSILVKPDTDSNEIKSADKISVSLNFISAVPVPDFEVGDRVRIIYNGEIAESYPAQINKVFAVYLLSDDGLVLSPTPSK